VKVIRCSALDEEGPRGDERVVREDLTEDEARRLADAMNRDLERGSDDWFRVVPDSHVPRVFEP
jgi:hypothetical protein